MDVISRWTPSVSSVQKARVLLLGAVGAGKSSFFNTLSSVFKGHVSCRANTGIAGTSLTTQVHSLPVQKNLFIYRTLPEHCVRMIEICHLLMRV